MTARDSLPPRQRPSDNPYAPGAGCPPRALAGRERQIEDVAVLIERAQAGNPYRSLIVTGLRGVGKTVLLNRFEDMAQAARWPTVFREIPGVPDDEDDFRSMMAAAAHHLLLQMNRTRRLGDAADSLLVAIRQLRPKVSVSESGTPEISLTVEGLSGQERALGTDLTEVFLELGKAARAHKTGVMILLDEVQNLDRADLGALIMALHRVSQKGLPVVVIAAGLPNLPKLASQVETYVERLFKMASIGQLDDADARAAISEPAHSIGVTFTPAALAEVSKAADRWPYFLQEWGQEIWDEATSTTIERSDVVRATPAVLAALDAGFFRSRYGRASDRERDYLHAMADLGAGPYGPAEVIAHVTGGDAKTWAQLRARLIGKGLIYSPGHNQIDFTVPHFGDFLQREQARSIRTVANKARVGKAGRKP